MQIKESTPLGLPGPLFILIGAVMISFSAVFVKLTTTEPTVDAFYRMFFGGIGLVFVSLWQRKPFYTSRYALLLAMAGGVLFASDLVFWHRSILYIGPGLATIIVNLQVIALGLLGMLVYGDRITRQYLFSLPLALIGMYLLVGTKWFSEGMNYQLGIYLSFVALFCYICYIIVLRLSQDLPKRLDPSTNLAINSLVAAGILALIAAGQHESFITTRPLDWLWLILYGVFGQMLGWLCISIGLPHTSVSRAGFLLLLQPSLAYIWDVLFFGHATPLGELSGVVITLSAIYLGAVSRRVK